MVPEPSAADIVEAADEADHHGWRPTRRARVALLVVVVGIAAGYLMVALGLPIGTISQPRHGLFPVAVGALMVASGTIAILQDLRVARASQPGKGRTLLGLIGGMVAYAAVADIVGHLVAATLIAAGTLVLVGERRWWRVVVYALAIGIGSYVVFDTLLGTPLPASRYRIVF